MKKLVLGALAAVSMSAFAQTTYTSDSSKGWVPLGSSVKELPASEVNSAVCNFAKTTLTGGDAYAFEELTMSVPSNIEWAIKEGIANALQQTEYMKIGGDNISWTNTGKQIQYAIVKDNVFGADTYAIVMGPRPDGTSESGRALRFAASQPGYVQLRYDDALKILGGDLDQTKRGVLAHWWNQEATEGQRDTLVRVLRKAIEINALGTTSSLRNF